MGGVGLLSGSGEDGGLCLDGRDRDLTTASNTEEEECCHYH